MTMRGSHEDVQFKRSEMHEEHQEALAEALSAVGERIMKNLEEAGRLLPIYENLQDFVHGAPRSKEALESLTVADIAKCRNQRAALRYMAVVNGGDVRVRDVARVIHESALSRGTLSSVRSALLRYVKESYEWENLGHGWFRLLTVDDPGISESPKQRYGRRVLAELEEMFRAMQRQAAAAGLVSGAAAPALDPSGVGHDLGNGANAAAVADGV